jgi:hypothetical protein
MIKFFTQFFTGLRNLIDEDVALRWIIPIALVWVSILAFAYMKMIFGAIFLVYILMIFLLFLYGKITVVEETDEYVKKEFKLFNISLIVKIDKK